MKKIEMVKNYKVTMDKCSILNSTGEIDEINHEEFFFMTKEEAKRKIDSYEESYNLWKTIKEDFNGFEKAHKSSCLTGKCRVSMQEVNLIGTVKYKVTLSEEYDFSKYPSIVEVFDSIEEAQEYFNNLLEEKRENWERGREGMIFAICTSEAKAIEAESLLKAQGFEDIKTKKSNFNLDEIKIGKDTISL